MKNKIGKKRKKTRFKVNQVFLYERKTGLGPATPTLARLCSTNWATSAFALFLKSDAKIRHFFYPANFRTSFLPIFFKILDFYGFYLLYKYASSGIKNAVFLYHISSGCLRDSFGISAFRMTTINELIFGFEYKESAETQPRFLHFLLYFPNSSRTYLPGE